MQRQTPFFQSLLLEYGPQTSDDLFSPTIVELQGNIGFKPKMGTQVPPKARFQRADGDMAVVGGCGGVVAGVAMG